MITAALCITAAAGCYYSKPIASSLSKLSSRVDRMIRPVFDCYSRSRKGKINSLEEQREVRLRREVSKFQFKMPKDIPSAIEIYLHFAPRETRRAFFEMLKDQDPEIFYPIFLFTWRGMLFSPRYPSQDFPFKQLKEPEKDPLSWLKLVELNKEFNALSLEESHQFVTNPLPVSIDGLPVSEQCKKIYREVGGLASESLQGNESFRNEFDCFIKEISQDEKLLEPKGSQLPTSLKANKYAKAQSSRKNFLSEEFEIYGKLNLTVSLKLYRDLHRVYEETLSAISQAAFARRIRIDPLYARRVILTQGLRALLIPEEQRWKKVFSLLLDYHPFQAEIELIRLKFQALPIVDQIYFMRTSFLTGKEKFPQKLAEFYTETNALVEKALNLSSCDSILA